MEIEKINRLNNEYRALIREAEDKRANAGTATREEGLCYQYASGVAGQLATASIGSERQYWISEQDKCEKKRQSIWYTLHPEDKPERKAPEAKPASTGKKPAPASGGAAQAKQERNSEELPERWFPADPGYGFDKVVGMDELKQLLQSCVRDAAMEELNEYLGMATVRSFFFYGPPGCGKTFIIEAFVHELMQKGYRYMRLESADVHNKFSGEADKAVRNAFNEVAANEEKLPYVLFMDEIDGICQSRSLPNLSDHNMSLTTTFLTSYNMLNKANEEGRHVIFIGATNYPANVDMAMLDRVEMVQVPLPDERVREFSLRSKFEKKVKQSDGTEITVPIVQLADDITWEEMAEATEGYNQRDINRVSDHLRMLVRTGAAEYAASSKNAVEALKNGEFRLTRAMFEQAMAMYHPAPKDDVEKALNDFVNNLRKH